MPPAWREKTVKSSSVEVAYAAQMKPGDLYAGDVDPAAPTRPVQVFAAAHRLTGITPYADGQGRRMLHLQAGVLTLTPVAAAGQVLLIREGELTPDRVTRYLAQHGVPTWVPAGAGGTDDGRAEAGRLTRLAESLGASWLVLGERVHDLASSAASEVNNNGLAGQVAYLIRQAGPAGAERMIRETARQGTERN
jgi:hypothetical protein